MYDVLKDANYAAKEIIDKLAELNILTEQAENAGWNIDYKVYDSGTWQQINVSMQRDYWPAAPAETQ